MSLTIHMMTAALAQGDAIGNYILSLTKVFREWGCTVRLYSDHPNPNYPLDHRYSDEYRPTGNDILWLHYSIYSENIHWLRESIDFKIIDSQNVCPAYLFHGYDDLMEQLCARGESALDTLPDLVDLAVVHTEYVRADLLRRGFRRIRKLPMVVDTGRFTGEGDPAWEPLLSKLDYLSFVGRIVPQKNLTLAIEVFAALRRRRPGIKLFLVGGRHLPGYAAKLEALAERLGVADDVVFTGPIAEPHTLTSFFRNARFYLCLSEWESFCVPIAESLYFGAPVLGWDVPPIPETIGPGGLLLSGDAEAMAAQIDAVWADQARHEALAQAGRKHVDKFTDLALRAELLALLRELAEGV
jgi:glycosyltransferase involved in cell wall biosynthesis